MISGLLMPLGSQFREALALVVCVLAILIDSDKLPIHLPHVARQVPRTIFTKGIHRASLQFGFEMGLGFLTHLTSAWPYAVLAAVVLLQLQFPVALMIGLGFGLGRAVVPIMGLLASDQRSWGALLSGTHAWLPMTASLSGTLALLFLLIRT